MHRMQMVVVTAVQGVKTAEITISQRQHQSICICSNTNNDDASLDNRIVKLEQEKEV